MLSAFSFSLMGVCVKAVGARLPAAEVVLVRAVVSLTLSWWMLRRAGLRPWGQRRGLLVLRGVIGSIALLCVYAALAQLPLAAATVLQYLYPTFTALLAWLLLGERIGLRLLAATALAWLGVLLVARPSMLLAFVAGIGSSAPELPPQAVLLAVAGALFTALAYVSVRSLGRSEQPLVIVFYFPLVALPLSLPLVLLEPLWPNAGEWLALLGVGVFTQLGQVGLTRGLLALPAAQATALSTVQVLFAIGWGWLLFGESPNGWSLAGGLLILAAALLGLPWGSAREAAAQSARKR